MRILMVEDERQMAEAVAQVLKKENYAVDLAFDGEYGLDCALSGIHDMIILDIMLPKLDGVSLLRALRARKLSTPVILLTAKGDTRDKVLGLDSGADDYLAKPFQTQELLARLRALSRRIGGGVAENTLAYGDISYDPRTLRLARGPKQHQLTLKEGQLMEMLLRNAPRILSSARIIENIWGYDGDAGDSNVQVYVSFLRKKLALLGSAVFIRAVRGAGYTLSNEEICDV